MNNWWVAGNFVVGAPEVTASNRLGIHPAGGVMEEICARAPFQVATVATQPASEAFELVLKQAGAILPRRDSLDARIIEETRTGTARFGGAYGDSKGIIDSPVTVGGWPELKSVTPPNDSDGDGMPDEWEKKHGLNPNNPSDGPQDNDKDGYTNLEEFLNGTDPANFVDYTKPENSTSNLK